MRHPWVRKASTQLKTTLGLYLFFVSFIIPHAIDDFVTYGCFAHIVNISVQHVLSFISNYFEQSNVGNPLSKVHQQITHLPASYLCCTAFWTLISLGNATGDFKQKVPEVELLRDMPVRWDSTFLMIQQFLQLWLVSCFAMLSCTFSFTT